MVELEFVRLTQRELDADLSPACTLEFDAYLGSDVNQARDHCFDCIAIRVVK